MASKVKCGYESEKILVDALNMYSCKNTSHNLQKTYQEYPRDSVTGPLVLTMY